MTVLKAALVAIGVAALGATAFADGQDPFDARHATAGPNLRVFSAAPAPAPAPAVATEQREQAARFDLEAARQAEAERVEPGHELNARTADRAGPFGK